MEWFFVAWISQVRRLTRVVFIDFVCQPLPLDCAGLLDTHRLQYVSQACNNTFLENAYKNAKLKFFSDHVT